MMHQDSLEPAAIRFTLKCLQEPEYHYENPYRPPITDPPPSNNFHMMINEPYTLSAIIVHLTQNFYGVSIQILNSKFYLLNCFVYIVMLILSNNDGVFRNNILLESVNFKEMCTANHINYFLL